jgi:hypothetical protein
MLTCCNWSRFFRPAQLNPAILFFVCFLGNIFLAAVPAHAASPPPFENWQTLETTHFRINFNQQYLSQAERLALIAEMVYPDLTDFLQWQPKTKTHINLFDFTDATHGWANVIPYPVTGIFMTPPDEGELLLNDDWLRMVFTHEFLHIVHLDKVRATPAGLQQIFGRHPWLFPNRFQPGWITEGLATYAESVFSPINGGRTQGSHYEAMMRVEVENGLKPLSAINTNGDFWPLNHHYLYGSYFFLFLEEEFGKPAIVRSVNDFSNNLIPFRIVSNPVKSTGLELPELWQRFEAWLHRRFDSQISSLNKHTVSGQALTQSAYMTGRPVQNNRGELFYVENNGYSHPRLVKRDTNGQLTRLSQLQRGARIDSHPEQGIIIAQAERCDHNRTFFDLFLLSPGKEKPERLTKCSRYRLASWHPNGESFAAVHINQGIVRIDLLSKEGIPFDTLYRGQQGESINSIDWTPNGEHLLVSRKIDHQWNLYLLSTATRQWQNITDDDAIQIDAKVSDDGRKIVYSSDRGGQFRIHLLDLDSYKVSILNRQIGSAWQPSGYGESGLLGYVSIGSKGQDIYQLGLDSAEADAYQLKPPPAIENTLAKQPFQASASEYENDLPANDPAASKLADYKITPYQPWRSLPPTAWEPAWQSDDGDSMAYGLTFFGQDAIGLQQYRIKLMKETDLDEYFGSINYIFDRRLFLGVDKEFDVIYTQADQPAIYETNVEYQMLYAFPLDASTLNERWQISPAYSFERVKYKSRDKSLQAGNENVLGLHFLYSSVEQFQYSHGPAQGRSVELIAESYDLLHNEYTGEVYTLDWHEYIPLKGSVLALRFMQGWGTKNPTPFELGGVFSEHEFDIPRINQRNYSLRGYSNSSTELNGRRARLASLEWRIPLKHNYVTLMAPPVGFGKISATLFAESGSAWNDGSSPDTYYSSSGAEVLAQIILGYNLVLDTRFGYAHGFDEIGEDRYYVRFGRAF